MNKKILIGIIVIVILGLLVFFIFNKEEKSLEDLEPTPVSEESTEEDIETSEKQIEEPVEEIPEETAEEEDNGSGSDVEVNGSVADGITLTDEERQQIIANANGGYVYYTMEDAIEIYEKANNGGYTYPGYETEVYTKTVGSPYDTSWRRMTDEEAQAILNGEVEGNKVAAEAELANGAWQTSTLDTIYYDVYEYLELTHAEYVANKEAGLILN